MQADVTPHCNMTAMLKSVVMDSSICRPWGSLIGRPMGRAGPILLGAAETDIPKLVCAIKRTRRILGGMSQRMPMLSVA